MSRGGRAGAAAIVAALVGGALGASCSKPASGSAAPPMASAPVGAGLRVTIDNFSFNPPVLTVPAGSTVTWTNRDDVPHSATSSEQPRRFDSGPLDTDQSFSFEFDEPGTYPYFCTVHSHMTGQIVVTPK